ncbi:MAG: FecR domain-containing protein [Deltaproteobacteria bacterium]|nr:FecR domain-containing protein [Deltaproteobacteria bacterium]
MSAHVAPHRWADLWAGRVGTAERALMERHAAAWLVPAHTRARVQRASDSFTAIRDQKAPDLAWDSVRARVHWSVSTERRAKVPPPRRWPWPAWAAFAAATAGAVTLALVTGPISLGRDADEAPVLSNAAIHAPSPARAEAPAAAALIGLVNRTTGDVLVDGVRPAEPFARRIVAGNTLVTGDGGVDVQFGEASAFALGPRSRLELRRFDAQAIELVVEGTLDVQVAARAKDQRFTVIAGDRVVEVRGTQFRVQHDASATSVACRHGLVEIGRADRTPRIAVAAAKRVTLGPDERVVPLTADELAALADATPLSLPMWNPDVFEHGSAPLEIATAGRREIRVDGVELGTGPMRVRVMPGRHTVEAADNAGRFRRAGWVDVAAPTKDVRPARLEIPAEAPPTRDLTARRRQFAGSLDRARLAACTRSAAKQGLTGAYVQLEITVDAQGAVNALNIVDTDLPKLTRGCVLDAIRDTLRFQRGAAATWRERVEL